MEKLNTTLTRLKSSIGIESIQKIFEPEKDSRFDAIELDLEETEAALLIAKKEKYYRLNREKYFEKISEEIKFISRPAEKLFEDFKAADFRFANDEHEKKIKNICLYFANDKRFVGDLGKGLLLIGSKGTGKTELMRFFQSNQNHNFKIEAMLDIQFDYKMTGEKGVDCYGKNFSSQANAYGLKDFGYCFDDLGTEEIPCRHFAESKNIFSEIIQTRYNNRLPFNSTHAISNKTTAEMEEAYGSRCYDRMREMFNVISFSHESFRVS